MRIGVDWLSSSRTGSGRAWYRPRRGIVEAREAIRELMSVAGSSAFAESNPLQRISRDSEMAGRHAVSNPSISAEVYGRLLLGIDEPTIIPL